MWWPLMLIVIVLLGILLLPFQVGVLGGYGKDGGYSEITFCIWKKAIFRKKYAVADLLAKAEQHSNRKAKKGKLQRKMAEGIKANWHSLVPLIVKDITVVDWTFSGNMGVTLPEIKALLYGGASGGSWWFYGVSERWLHWQCHPVINLFFSPADTNWQFRCMIRMRVGQIIGKGIKIAVIFIRRGIKNGAKERNRSAHANSYL